MKKINLIFLLIIFFYFVYFIYSNQDKILGIRLVNPIYLLFIFLSFLIFLVLSGYINKILLKKSGLNIGLKECVGLSAINALGNYVTPFKGGMISNAIYLKKKFKFKYSNFLLINSVYYAITFGVNSLIMVLTMVVTDAYKLNNGKWLLLIASTVLTLTTLILILKPNIKNFEKLPSKLKMIVRAINNWGRFSEDRALILKLVILSILTIGISSSSIYLGFLVIDSRVEFYKIIIVSVVNLISLFVSITPANLGVKEALMMFSGNLVDIDQGEMLVVSLINRVLYLLVSSLLGIYFVNKVSKFDNERISKES